MQYPIRAVLFDLDNTLADREAAFTGWSRWFAREHLGFQQASEIAAAVATLVAFDDDGYLPRDLFFRKVKAQYPLLETGVDALIAAFRTRLGAHLPPLDMATATLLEALDTAGLPWGIVTNGSSQNQRSKIRHLGLEARAGCIVISEEVQMRKPDPAIFLLAAEWLHTSPRDVLFVGDHPEHDVLGAARVGMQTAWVRRDRSWPALLTGVAVAMPMHQAIFEAIRDRDAAAAERAMRALLQRTEADVVWWLLQEDEHGAGGTAPPDWPE